MKTKCYSVRLRGLVSVSDKAYRATAFDASEAIIPKSQFFGVDTDIQKSDAFWISAWILDRVSLQHSKKKVRYFDSNTGEILPDYIVSVSVPKKRKPLDDNSISCLKK